MNDSKHKVLAGFFVLIILTGCKKPEYCPNIVLIMADDMGYECLGSSGNIEYKTPNLDRLAENSIRFIHCYSQPLCTPSRVKIMTGKYNFRNYEDFGYLNPNQQTFGNLLKDAGYSTCIAGKWQLNGLNRNNPFNQDLNRPHHFGFDEYCLWQLNRTRDEGERFANPLITQNGQDLPRNSNAYGPQVFADYVCNFIERNADTTFFVYYPMVLVHEPFVPTPDSPEWKNPADRYTKDTAYFADMMNYTDKIVGQIEAKLKEKGVWENTLFIFTADNGTHPTVISSTVYGNIQGGKGLSVNTGNRVPLVVSWPEKMKAGKEPEVLVSFADVLPTLCEAAGVSSDKYTSDGKSFLSLVKGTQSKIQDEIFIHYSPRWGNFKHNRWVMNGTYKLYHDGRFYNTRHDPLEKNGLENLSDEELKVKNKFQQILNDKEAEVPFALNDTIFKVNY